jgi:hypothetical protein
MKNLRGDLYGGYPVASDVRPSIVSMHEGRVKSCDSNPQISPWPHKFASGSIEQETSNSGGRMDSSPDSSGPGVQTLG